MASKEPDAGHEVPPGLLPTLLTSTLGAPATALGLLGGVLDTLAGAARLVAGYTLIAVLSSAAGAAQTR